MKIKRFNGLLHLQTSGLNQTNLVSQIPDRTFLYDTISNLTFLTLSTFCIYSPHTYNKATTYENFFIQDGILKAPKERQEYILKSKGSWHVFSSCHMIYWNLNNKINLQHFIKTNETFPQIELNYIFNYYLTRFISNDDLMHNYRVVLQIEFVSKSSATFFTFKLFMNSAFVLQMSV